MTLEWRANTYAGTRRCTCIHIYLCIYSGCQRDWVVIIYLKKKVSELKKKIHILPFAIFTINSRLAIFFLTVRCVFCVLYCFRARFYSFYSCIVLFPFSLKNCSCNGILYADISITLYTCSYYVRAIIAAFSMCTILCEYKCE